MDEPNVAIPEETNKLLSKLNEYYDSLFIDNTLVLDRFESLCEVISRFGDLRFFNAVNLMLLASQNPYALDIKTEYEWELYGHKVNVDALSLSLFARNENNKYVPRTYFDVSSTDISSDNYNENYFPDELMLALSSAFIASDIKLYAVNSEAVDFEEWCQLRVTEFEEYFIEIRRPTLKEIEEKNNFEIRKLQFKGLVKCYCLFYFSVIEASIPDKPFSDDLPEADIDALSNFVTDLICKRFKIVIANDYSYSVYPEEFNGSKPDTKLFRDRIEQALVCFRFLVNSMSFWLELIRNPEPATDVHVEVNQDINTEDNDNVS